MARSNSFRNVLRLLHEEAEHLPPEQNFLKDLERSIELDDEKNKRLPSRTYKPSGMNCIRASYYQIMGIEPDQGSSSYVGIGICNSGTDIHLRIQSAVNRMKANGMDCEYVNVADYVQSRNLDYLEIRKEPNFEQCEFETKLYHKLLNLSFLCDGIIKYKGHYYILELKTESSYKFMNRKATDPGHYNQATAYATVLGIDDVLFVYINRDLLDMKSFIFTPTTEMKENFVSYINECDGYVARMVAPPKPEQASAKFCQYCGYRTQCRKDG